MINSMKYMKYNTLIRNDRKWIGVITISESWLGERDHDKFYEIHEVQYTDQK